MIGIITLIHFYSLHRSKNDYASEKINDIYVNRNVGQLYSNVTKPSHKQKAIATSTAYDGNAYVNTYKGFFLHHPSNNNEKLLNDSKIYNAFSKQKNVVPTLENKQKTGHNEYLMGNIPAATVIRAKHTPIENWNATDIFEDDEFASLLGYAMTISIFLSSMLIKKTNFLEVK